MYSMVMSDIFMQYFIGSVGGLFELEMEMECFLGCGFHLNLAPILSLGPGLPMH
jgi:hypothetical protein